MRPVTRAAAVAALLAVAACSPPRAGSLGAAPTAPAATPSATGSTAGRGPSPDGSAGPTPAPPSATPGGPLSTGPGGTVTVQVWFTRGGRIVPTARTRPATPATSRLALEQLAAGPSTVEVGVGMGSAVAAGTAFAVSGIAAGVETVRVPAGFTDGTADAQRLRRAQVVWTLTQFPAVTRVAFAVGAGGPGTPQGRDAFADLLPPIVVTAPLTGQAVESPIGVAGTAEVFEATVSVRVLDAAGHVLATTFTLASCGSGCRGGYRVAVAYRSPVPQRGVVEVYQVSPRDGSRVDLVAVPVLLAAA